MYPNELKYFIECFKKLPGIGPRSAERIAFFLLDSKESYLENFGHTFKELIKNVTSCKVCGFYASIESGCPICLDANRNKNILCVVEFSNSILALERAKAFSGQYHVLGGKISPLNQVYPENLRIRELILRIQNDNIKEIVLALGLDVEGEATSHYLLEELKKYDLKISKPAQGIPAGSHLENIDNITLYQALEKRSYVNDKVN